MEAERDGLWNCRPRDLRQVRCVQDEQEGCSCSGVQNDRQDHSVVFSFCPRSWHKDRFAGIRVWFVPNPGFAAADIDLSEAIEEGRRICRVH